MKNSNDNYDSCDKIRELENKNKILIDQLNKIKEIF